MREQVRIGLAIDGAARSPRSIEHFQAIDQFFASHL